MNVVTRFAPSPTGYLHIGGARTALFNWLFARHHGGKYLLRIEDTDRQRSTDDAIAAIHEGLAWLGLQGDEAAVSQSARADRHVEVADALLQSGAAYRCYLDAEELATLRDAAHAEGKPVRSPWRDKTQTPDNVEDRPFEDRPFVVRMRMPDAGETTIEDAVQGIVTVKNTQLDDMVILRADASPTYMLAVVVDDHDMGITHVIRGDDHLNNAFRQVMVYRGMGWDVPVFAHIPLIHGADGAKLSKRHGALGVEAYRDMGFEIVIFTARNMLTHQGEIGKINVHTLPIVLDWLNRHEVPYDQVIVGKPWCGTNGFYVDDRAIRPDEFKNLSRMEIKRLLGENDAQS